MNKIKNFAYSLALVGITATVASFFSMQAMRTFYHSLNMPMFSPPDAVFSPVWAVLYSLMIFSYFIVLNSSDKILGQSASLLFLGQLFLQMIWSYLFFGMGFFSSAVVVMFLMVWTVYKMIEQFKNINKTAGILQYPYLFWLIFATYLNIGIAYMN